MDGFKKITLAAKTPWDYPVVLADGRCYHEGYPGKWFSYSNDDRADKKQSVSLYQWRSPGEWFAELYAWHYIEGDAEKRKKRTDQLPEGVKTVMAAKGVGTNAGGASD